MILHVHLCIDYFPVYINMFVNDQEGRLVYSLVYLLGIELRQKVMSESVLGSYRKI